MKEFKRFVICCTLIIFSNLMIFGNEFFNFSLTPELGFLNGHIYEYVYNTNCKNTDNLESMLDWELMNVPYAEINASFDFYKYINLTLTGNIAMPVHCGSMQDYDWLNSLAGIETGIPESWINDDPTELTNYSKHENYLSDYYTFTARLGINIQPYSFIKITPFGAFDYYYFNFNSMNGYKKYKSDSFQEISTTGKAISYSHESVAFFMGLTADINIHNKAYVSSLFTLCPYTAFNNAVDHHWAKNYVYWDDLNNVLIIKGKVSAGYIFNSKSQIGVSFNYNYTPLTKGNDYLNKLDNEGNYVHSKFLPSGVEGGSSAFIWSIGLTYTYRF